MSQATVASPSTGVADDERTILLLDGVELFLRLETTILARAGHRVLTARRFAEARDLALAHAPELVILDYVLPDASGEEVVRWLRSEPVTSRAAILIVTARGMREHVDACMRAGCNSFLFKPVTSTALNARVEELLRVPGRRHVRTPVRLQVGAQHGQHFFFGDTVNVSASGMLLETSLELALGDAIHLHFFLPGEDDVVSVRARVVRRDRPHGALGTSYGLEFDGLDDSARRLLEDFVVSRRPAEVAEPVASGVY